MLDRFCQVIDVTSLTKILLRQKINLNLIKTNQVLKPTNGCNLKPRFAFTQNSFLVQKPALIINHIKLLLQTVI